MNASRILQLVSYTCVFALLSMRRKAKLCCGLCQSSPRKRWTRRKIGRRRYQLTGRLRPWKTILRSYSTLRCARLSGSSSPSHFRSDNLSSTRQRLWVLQWRQSERVWAPSSRGSTLRCGEAHRRMVLVHPEDTGNLVRKFAAIISITNFSSSSQ
jgi:hypothetical protein